MNLQQFYCQSLIKINKYSERDLKLPITDGINKEGQSLTISESNNKH